jgi:molybdopterin/thiamine biosynthesis adenylyltransferase
VVGPWWIAIPGRFEFEIEALRKVCSEVAVYKQDEKSGHLGIKLVFELEGKSYPLRAEFPATYPFTRPMVYAEKSSFKWHQNPYGKNLCLLGRTAENWLSTCTLAQHLSEQMPKIIASNATSDPKVAAELEELQAEPFTTFLTYQLNSSMLLLHAIPAIGRDKGSFVAACAPFGGVLRGVLLSLTDDENRDLTVIPDAVGIGMQFSKPIHGKWYRMAGQPLTANAKDFLEQIVSIYPEARKRNWTTHRDRRFEVIGVLLPEENGWRAKGESMLFIVVQSNKMAGGRRMEMTEFVRTLRAGRDTLSARIPEMAGLSNKRILLAGAGSLGGFCAVEFARNGLGRLNLVDADFVEAGNSVRWQLGMSLSGLPKVSALQSYIAANHPFTQVMACPVDVGSEGYSLEIEEQLYKGVDLVFDATAERGISYLLSERARALGIPYLAVTSTQGNWGGTVLTLRPERKSPCWLCLCLHWEDGALALPSCGPEVSVQVGGCASPTFTGVYMDSSETALMAVRLAVSLLVPDYPAYDWDYAAVSLRESSGIAIPPRWSTGSLTCHVNCPNHTEHVLVAA